MSDLEIQIENDQLRKLLNTAFDCGLNTMGAVGIGMASYKIVKDSLGVPMTKMAILKMALALTEGATVVQYLQDAKILPLYPFVKKKYINESTKPNF